MYERGAPICFRRRHLTTRGRGGEGEGDGELKSVSGAAMIGVVKASQLSVGVNA